MAIKRSKVNPTINHAFKKVEMYVTKIRILHAASSFIIELTSLSIQVRSKQIRKDTSTNASETRKAEQEDARILFVKNTAKHRLFPKIPTPTMRGTQTLLIIDTATTQFETSPS
jgi:hypothetical protein